MRSVTRDLTPENALDPTVTSGGRHLYSNYRSQHPHFFDPVTERRRETDMLIARRHAIAGAKELHIHTARTMTKMSNECDHGAMFGSRFPSKVLLRALTFVGG